MTNERYMEEAGDLLRHPFSTFMQSQERIATALLAAEKRGMERAVEIAEAQWLEEGERAKKVEGEMRYLTLGMSSGAKDVMFAIRKAMEASE